MPYVKPKQTKSYFSRYQVKNRRRRKGLTDYHQRNKLVIQAKNKYATPRYRLVVRITNTRCICQIAYSTIMGDRILAEADSRELKRYGLKAGFKNYPAVYCTGLLVGRRVLQKLGLDEQYTGVGNEEEDEVTGEIMEFEKGKRKYFVDSEEFKEERKPFRVVLDVGLARTSLGSRVFAALKGCSDAGVDIPHNHKKFPGYDADEKTYDADFHRDVIVGAPIKEYMESLIADDEESNTDRFGELFAEYKKNDIGPDDLEDMYLAIHKAIREDPSPKHDKSHKERKLNVEHDKKYKKPRRLTKEERDANIQAKLAKIAASHADDDIEEFEEEEEEEE